MRRVEYLSHVLRNGMPVYGNNNVCMSIAEQKKIENGDSCNTYKFSMENHWGTHIDAPAHFFSGAAKILDYGASNWVFKYPCAINVPAEIEEKRTIGVEDVRDKVDNRCDLLLIKTGFGRFRDRRVYSFDHPIVSAEVAIWLRSEKPLIRAMGFDFVSVGCFRDRDKARETHRRFLDPEATGAPLVIIEDMDLSTDLENLKMVLVAPLLVDNLDSAPCTVFGFFS